MKRGKFTIMEKLFHLQDRNTTVKAELIGGITTFMAMSYILSVNPGMFTALGNVSCGASRLLSERCSSVCSPTSRSRRRPAWD